MAEKMQIIIEPSEAHPDFLTVQDAMEQVLDYFKLTSINDDSQDTKDIVWKLVSVTMQSPFVVTAEAVSFNPEINVDEIVKRQKGIFLHGIKNVLEGVTPREWASREARDTIDRILRRNQNGIGKTSIITDFQEKSVPIEITSQLAETAISEIHKQPSRFFTEDLTHKELGSVDGYLIAVGSEYNQPAIQIQDRLTEEVIWCRVPEETRNAISGDMQLNDVWKHRRIIVSGLIQYEKTGKISRIYDAQIETIATRKVSLGELHNGEFTEGMSPSEYLDYIRGVNLG